MSNFFVPIEPLSQSEQAGGFWLIRLKVKLTDEQPNLFDIGCLFYIEGSAAPLTLFQQTLSSNHIQLQLLSQEPLTTEKVSMQINYCLPDKANITLDCTELLAPNLIILGSELASANLFYLAKQRSNLIQEKLKKQVSKTWQTVTLLHSTSNFPFVIKPALFMAPDMPAEAIGCSTLLEDWQITNRLASDLGLPGCFDGQLIELFSFWLNTIDSANIQPEPWHVISCIEDQHSKALCLQICEKFNWIQLTSIEYGRLNQQ